MYVKAKVINPTKKKWVINLSDTTLTESQNQVLQLGLNFALAPKHVPVEKVIASVEKCLCKVTDAEATHIRSKVASAIKTHRPEPCVLSERSAMHKQNYAIIHTLSLLKRIKVM